MNHTAASGSARVCGVDEAGRGPLAGSVVAAAVILNPEAPIAGLKDSKQLSARQRDVLAQRIRDSALAWAVGSASVEEIDALNILQASLLAMQRAVSALPEAPVLALIDGHRAPALSCAVQTLIRGDALEPCISAASILAKTHRDAEMIRLHALYPHYGFDVHKGYPTRDHLEALRRHGPSPLHRRSFGPVRACLQGRLESPGDPARRAISTSLDRPDQDAAAKASPAARRST